MSVQVPLRRASVMLLSVAPSFSWVSVQYMKHIRAGLYTICALRGKAVVSALPSSVCKRASARAGVRCLARLGHRQTAVDDDYYESRTTMHVSSSSIQSSRGRTGKWAPGN